jgi:hypothetical protein
VAEAEHAAQRLAEEFLSDAGSRRAVAEVIVRYGGHDHACGVPASGPSLGCEVGMDVTDLASLAANTVVAAAVTDTYDTIRDRVARLFGRGNPDPATAQRLDKMRAELSDGTAPGAETIRVTHVAHWQVRFADLVEVYPEAADELARLAAEIQAELPVRGDVTNTIIGGVHHGDVLMGRDFTGIILHPDQGSASA